MKSKTQTPGTCVWFLAVIALLSPDTLAARDCADPAAVEQIASGVWVRHGYHAPVFTGHAVANIGFIVGRDCVAVIDTGGSPQEGEALRCAVRQHTDRPICYVVITHVHPDHSLGGLAFRDTQAQCIGHEKLPRALALVGNYYRRRMAELTGREPPAGLIVPPDRTVAAGEPLTLDLGGRTLRITAHEPAHTDTDLSIFDSASDTLWLSDLLFLEHIPVVDASSSGWLAVLDALRRQPAARAVPGHGPVSVPWPRAAADTRRYLETLQADLRRWMDQGGDLEGAQDNAGNSERGRWRLFGEFHKRNIIKVYTELEWE